MGHIADAVTRIALAKPAVHFDLTHNQRSIKTLPARREPQQRTVEILGANTKAHLRPIAFEHPALAINGWIGLPEAARSTTRGIFTYVNGRFVRDRVIQHALLDAYRQRLVKGQYPVAVIFINIPPDRVDVNVHPTKHEVRFLDQRTVHNTVAGIIRDSLAAADRPIWASPPETVSRPPAVNDRRIDFATGNDDPERSAQPAAGPTDRYAPDGSENRPPSVPTLPSPTASNFMPVHQPANQLDFRESQGLNALRVIGQLHGTYVMCESRQGLVIIDQHAAHERIVYERLKKQVREGKPSVQQLLIPETIELGYREATCLATQLDELKRFGLEIESFGGNTFVVKAVPAFLADSQIAPIILALAENTAAHGFSDDVETCRDEHLKLMACHSSLRAHRRLSAEQLKPLLSQLKQCQDPSHCPHGRPTWLKWDRTFLEKSFKRIV